MWPIGLLFHSRVLINFICIGQVDEYQKGRSLEELQNYMDIQLAVENVNADRTDEKIPENVPNKQAEENLVITNTFNIVFKKCLNFSTLWWLID